MTTALPLKNKSGYLHYCSDIRPVIRKSFPDIKSVDIVKKQGDGWKNLSDEEKYKYEEKAKVDKERYLKEKDEWAMSNPNVIIEKKVKVKRAKKAVAAPAAEEEEIVILDEELVQEDAPAAVVAPAAVAIVEEAVKEKKARAPNKFQNFCKVLRPKLKVDKPKLQPKEVLTELGAMWKALSPEEQEKYV
jgi:hypothetical protein